MQKGTAAAVPFLYLCCCLSINLWRINAISFSLSDDMYIWHLVKPCLISVHSFNGSVYDICSRRICCLSQIWRITSSSLCSLFVPLSGNTNASLNSGMYASNRAPIAFSSPKITRSFFLPAYSITKRPGSALRNTDSQ